MGQRLLGTLLKTGQWLDAGARAQGRWELEVSRTILRRWRVLLAALLPVVMFGVVEAAQAGLPSTLGGNKAFMPAFVTPMMFFGSVVTGLLAGLITGVIGAGGGYILTPALMSFGVKGIMAVGTDQFHLFAKAIMGTAVHRKLGNVNYWLAVAFVAGSAGGVTVGAWLNRAVYKLNPSLSETFITAVYVVVLGVLGFYALADWLWLSRSSGRTSPTKATTRLADWLQGLRLWPRVRFDQDVVPGGRAIAVYPVIVCGALVGLTAAIMGVGGGFLTFPMFVYGLGVSTATTVGTDIFQIIFTAGYSSMAGYACYGFVFYTAAIGMLLGSLIGVQVGAMVTAVVKGSRIRAFYAVTILAGFVNRLAAMPRKLTEAGVTTWPDAVTRPIEHVGVWVFFTLVGLFAGWVVWTFFRHLGELRPPAAEGRRAEEAAAVLATEEARR